MDTVSLDKRDAVESVCVRKVSTRCIGLYQVHALIREVQIWLVLRMASQVNDLRRTDTRSNGGEPQQPT